MALWNFTIDDTSPYLSFGPSVDGSALTTAWRTWYQESLYNTVPDEVGHGASFHLTSLQGANVTFQFFGSGLSLFGTSNTTYSVTIDRISQGLVNSPTNGLLFSKYGLVEDLHSVTLSAQTPPLNSSLLALDFASISSSLRRDENPPSPIFYDSSNTVSLQYSGTWTTGNMNGVPNTTVSTPFQQTTSQGATVALSFTGGVAVAVKGMTGSTNGLYSVSVDGNTSTFNGKSTWTVPDALLFFNAGLDPNSTHHINITNLSDDSRLCLNSITVYQYESKNQPPLGPPKKLPSPARPSISIGVIIGPIIGTLVLCLLGGLFWYCRRRATKRRRQTPQTYIPRPYAVPGDMGGTIAVGTPALSMTTTIPFDDSSTASDTNFLTPGTAYMRPNQSHIYPISLADAAARKRLTKSTLGGDGWPSSPTTLSHTDTGYTQSNSPRSEYNELHGSASLGQTSSSSASSPRSPRRKPLPVIPVPSYDAALQALPLSPREVKSMSSLTSSPHDSLDIAPPQYER
ncbi:hypothetical protein BDZ94DRAFT_1243030 [Collybia nuda]|uniref:Transmembrane protein n=1 Tax=Collybia nuda TaxID=64659 RepID=A0A9P5YJ70_9AGAR|nr:hypothetical protein BDZ94DRAFT_1243030 [Collybia nuda]